MQKKETEGLTQREMVPTEMGPVCLSKTEYADYALKKALARNPAPFCGVIFDMDGVIFDSEREVLYAWQQVAKRHSIPDIEKVIVACLGTNFQATRRTFDDYYGKDFPFEQYEDEMRTIFFARYDERHGLPLKKGAVELLQDLKSRGVPVALASSTREKTVRKELTDVNIIQYFDVLVCGDMVKRSKPAPDIFLKAAEAISIPPETGFVIEDSYNGVRAAYAAELRPIMVPDLKKPDEEMRQKTEAIFPDLEVVQTYFDALGVKL